MSKRFNEKLSTSLSDLHDEEFDFEQYIDMDAKDLDMARRAFEEDSEAELNSDELARARRIRLATGVDPNSKGSKWDRFKVD
tara:strand:- start:5069 stop:5314 length:246 start_codon:yes stop_codon:yes gene_type:complete